MNTETAIREALRDLDVAVRPEFLRALQEQLETEGTAELADEPAPRRHRARTVILAAIAAALVIAIGAFVVVHARSNGQQEVDVSAGPEGDARALAQQMLDTLVAPPNAQLQKAPPPTMSPFLSTTHTTVTKQWFVPESTDTVLAFFKGHRSPQFNAFGSGTGPDGFRSVTWELKSLPASTAAAQVDIAFTPVKGKSNVAGTIVTAASSVMWYPVRPASEAIPARDKVAIIDQYPKNQHKIISDPADVAKLIAAFDQEHLLLDGPHSCPPIVDPNALLYTVRFAPAPGAPSDLVIKVPAHNCGGAEVTVNGQPQPSIAPEHLNQAVGTALHP